MVQVLEQVGRPRRAGRAAGRPVRLSRRELIAGSAAAFGLGGCALAAQTAPRLLLSEFGVGPGTGPAENEAGMRAALEAARGRGGAELALGPGHYRFAVRYPWEIPGGTRLVGAGKDLTTIERADAAPHNWMQAKNSIGANGFFGFTAIGNSRANVAGDGAFFFAYLDELATGPMTDFAFADLELRNFGGDGWIWFLYLGPSPHDIARIRVEGSCSFRSAPGNARGPRDIGIWSSALVFRGSLDPAGSAGRLRDVAVGPVQADIPHIKSLCIFWGGVVDGRIERPMVERCGTIGIGSNCGAYALVVGNETMGAPNPDRIDIVGPTIKACLSVGVYFVSWGGSGGTSRFDGSGGYIANVTDTANGSLPKGAIAATDGATNLIIRNLRAIDCVAAVDVPLATGARLLVDGVDAEGIPANQNGVRVAMQEGFTNTGPAAGVELHNIRVRSTAPGVTGVRFDTRFPMGPVRIGGTIDLDVPYIGVSAYNEGGAGTVAPFSAFRWEGEVVISNAVAGAIVLRGNVSPMEIAAGLTLRRGDRAGLREERIKAAGARNLALTGEVRIEGARPGDHAETDVPLNRASPR